MKAFCIVTTFPDAVGIGAEDAWSAFVRKLGSFCQKQPKYNFLLSKDARIPGHAPFPDVHATTRLKDFGTSPGQPELSQDEKKSQQRISRASVLQASELESCSRT
jgi:hypothetical protein